MGGFLIFSTFYLVQDLVSLVDTRANLLLPSKARRVFEIPDDASILEMQLRREIELNQHVAETFDVGGGSERAGKPPASARPATTSATCFRGSNAGIAIPKACEKREYGKRKNGAQRQRCCSRRGCDIEIPRDAEGQWRGRKEIEQGGCPGRDSRTRGEARVRPLNNYRHPPSSHEHGASRLILRGVVLLGPFSLG